MKAIFRVTVFLTLLIFCGCNDTTLQDLEVAQGKISGKDWVFKQGNAIFKTDEIEIILMNFETSNPCGVLNPSAPHMKFTVPAATGTYSIPFGTTAKTVKFYEGALAKNYSSTSGFIQIVGINGFTVDGLIQASFDDDNDVTGAFFATSCN
ncbi:MAG: hypothetical protein ACJA08_000335 [Cyclobacteriaceae bacterium]|jgi:hypothetical protein